MKLFEFASCRGPNFKIEANTVEEAWKLLVDREKDNGSLWKTSDIVTVENHLRHGWMSYSNHQNGLPVAYKIHN